MKRSITLLALVSGIFLSSFSFDEPANKEKRRKKEKTEKKSEKKEKKKFEKSCGIAGKH